MGMSSNMRIPKVCQLCGIEFVARTTTTQYCGDPCAKRAYKLRQRESKINQVLPIANQIREFSQDQIKNKDFLSLAETSRLLGASRMTIYRQIKSGKINAAKLGRRTIIKRSEIEKLFHS